ncbi:hypothetical protein Srot_2717 [Segniliparus rotundus DSM 44985]|uniref:Uncharacterized protein n=1 Tax=Segniliparus rotundus (strain ATCC BAA-972 / CDC 1076 / CIP 108378 / DSM 44985 / JCM 13578) TaxID=640132 RepID=D6ZCW4_SEGRD|nr:hypothetical protein [Segniliparus rotundus]ADG99151.1 hypothetical protein Srot_2717 [Segniliparus rotundus DSM 44985]
MGTGIENADAGHVADEVASILNRVDDVAHKALGLAERFYEAAAGVRYPDDASGENARAVLQSHTENRVGQMDSVVARLDGLIAKTRAGVGVQREQDGASAEGLAEVAREI